MIRAQPAAARRCSTPTPEKPRRRARSASPERLVSISAEYRSVFRSLTGFPFFEPISSMCTPHGTSGTSLTAVAPIRMSDIPAVVSSSAYLHPARTGPSAAHIRHTAGMNLISAPYSDPTQKLPSIEPSLSSSRYMSGTTLLLISLGGLHCLFTTNRYAPSRPKPPLH